MPPATWEQSIWRQLRGVLGQDAAKMCPSLQFASLVDRETTGQTTLPSLGKCSPGHGLDDVKEA